MGAPYYINDLSEYHIVWDLDMILLRNLTIFKKDHPSGPLKNVINIGGVSHPGYCTTYKNLTGRPLRKAPDGSSFVTHWMVVQTARMIEFTKFLGSKTPSVHAPANSTWVWNVLSATREDQVHVGFSEYASYNSWVLDNYPDSVYLMENKTWSRYPLGGGDLGMSLVAYLSDNKLCCPQDTIIKVMHSLGYQYFGVELSHHRVCKYHDPRFKNGYGI
eukprot:g1329.t1